MKEQNQNRLALIASRYEKRLKERSGPNDEAFDEAFLRACDAVIRPVFEEVAHELRQAGHEPIITVDSGKERPSIELRLGIRNAPKGWANLVAYCVIARRGRKEVLAYLEVHRTQTDLIRIAHPSEIERDQVEQLVLDATEHVFACNEVG